VIAAWGEDDQYMYHGANKARGTVRWHDQSLSGDVAFMETMEAADGYFEMRGENHPIKTVETEYFNYCFSWEELQAMGIPDGAFSVIGFQPIETAVEYLHHFTLFGAVNDMNGRPCSDYNVVTHGDLVYGWARGEPPVPLPLDVGLTVGPGSYQSFRLEVSRNFLQVCACPLSFALTRETHLSDFSYSFLDSLRQSSAEGRRL